MEVERNNNAITSNNTKEDLEENSDHIPLPGFRFHPTDEELVGFYLRRKVEKKQISLELIKQADIYKYDPWDLPISNSVGDKEWYFYCKRGRKYKNSLRPNRVTNSGFWKATGIDKPVYSLPTNGDHTIIGLKKSLVYYCGSSRKGTKTDWMMHEFRLPPVSSCSKKTTSKNAMIEARIISDEEAEVWTLCRIFKRNSNTNSYNKCVSDSRQTSTDHSDKRSHVITNTASSRTGSSIDSSDDRHHMNNMISFNDANNIPVTIMMKQNILKAKPLVNIPGNSSSSPVIITQYDPSFAVGSNDMLISHGADNYWEDLRSVMAFDHNTVAASNVNHSFYL